MSRSNEVISFKTPTKKAIKSTDFSLSLKGQKSDNLLKAQLESINKFCDAAEVHKDDVLDCIRPDLESMKSCDRHAVWHSDCYKNCVHINCFLKKWTYAEHIADAPEEEEEIIANKTHTNGKENCTWKMCIFCQKIYYKMKKKLTQVRIMSGQTFVIKAASRHDVELADLLMKIKNVNGELKTVINTVGGFHICLNFIGCIGGLYKCCGLEELIIDSNLYDQTLLHPYWLESYIIEVLEHVRC